MTGTSTAARCSLAALILAGATAGCALPTAYTGGPLDTAGSAVVRPELALVRLPEAWASRRLVVRREVVLNRMTERVVLSNDTALPFENRIEARTAWRGIAGSPFLRELPDGPFEASGVEAFAARQFPGAVKVSGPSEGVNRNGPYAYVRAAYAEGGPSCVYAWQVVAPPRGSTAGRTASPSTCAIAGSPTAGRTRSPCSTRSRSGPSIERARGHRAVPVPGSVNRM